MCQKVSKSANLAVLRSLFCYILMQNAVHLGSLLLGFIDKKTVKNGHFVSHPVVITCLFVKTVIFVKMCQKHVKSSSKPDIFVKNRSLLTKPEPTNCCMGHSRVFMQKVSKCVKMCKTTVKYGQIRSNMVKLVKMTSILVKMTSNWSKWRQFGCIFSHFDVNLAAFQSFWR